MKFMASWRAEITLKFALFGLILLWIASLTAPVARASTEPSVSEVFMGHDILLMGPFGILVGEFGWFANITFGLLLLTSFYSARVERTAVLSIFHLLFVASALGWNSWPADEGGARYYIINAHFWGYYSWFACVFAMPLFSVAHAYSRRDPTLTNDEAQ
ncbi:MAG: hypothetical protein ABL914_01860 [Novosphingobium sp.]|uniref:hypothetical protein n=1 Tax=Novosphingobium sp. TaxID=1874826 RepID=UPI0032BEBDD8